MISYHCEKCGRVFELDETRGGVCPACATPATLSGKTADTITDPARQAEVYQQALNLKNNAVGFGDWEKAGRLFLSIAGYKDADELAAQCQAQADEANKEAIYQQAKNRQGNSAESLKNRAALMRSIAGYKDADELAATYQRQADELAAEADRTREVKEAAQQVVDQATHRQNRRKRKVALVGALAAIVVIGAVLIVSLVVIPANQYSRAVEKFNAGDYAGASDLFAEITQYKDSTDYLQKAYYHLGQEAMARQEYLAAASYFEQAGDVEDAPVQLALVQETLYEEGLKKLQSGDYAAAQEDFDAAGGYEDAKDYKHFCRAMRVWNGDAAEAKKLDLTKAEDIIWKMMDGVWYSEESEQELTISTATRESDAPDLTIVDNALQWKADGVTYTVKMTTTTSFTLTGSGAWAGTYDKA